MVDEIVAPPRTLMKFFISPVFLETQVTEAEICNIASAICKEFHSSDAESGALLKKMDRLKKTGHASRVFADFEAAGLTADIKESFVNIGWQHPVLTFRNVISCLSRNNKLDLIIPHGLDVFETFWNRFKGSEPDHPIFGFPAEQRRRTLPVYIHADEGTSQKKRGIMVISVQGVVGAGTAFGGRHLNFLGNSLRARFLFATIMARQYRGKHAKRLTSLVSFLAHDLKDLFYKSEPVSRVCFSKISVHMFTIVL